MKQTAKHSDRRFWIKAAIGLLFAIVAFLVPFLAYHQQFRYTVVIDNQSGAEISWCEVAVCAKRWRFEDIPAGESISFDFTPNRDSHFEFEVLLASDVKGKSEHGYLTKNLPGERVTIVVDKDGKASWSEVPR